MSRIWLDDVAEAISNAHCPNDYLSAIGFKNNLLRQLRDAALNGELACYNSVGKYKPRAYETLISTTKEAVNLWLKSINSPYRYGQTEAVGDAETGNHAGTEPKQGNDKQQVNVDTGKGKVNAKSDTPRTRTTNLKRAINQAVKDIGHKPSFEVLWRYFHDDKDKSGFVEDYTDTHLIWRDTKGNMHDTEKETIRNHLSAIKS